MPTDMSPQIWGVNIIQRNQRNQLCRQEFFVLATTAEEAEQKARKRADRTRTVVEVQTSQRGEVLCWHA